MKAAKDIVNGAWSIPDYFYHRDRQLVEKILNITLPLEQMPDKLNWTRSVDGNLNNKLAYNLIVGLGQRSL